MLTVCLFMPSFIGLKLLDSFLRDSSIKNALINYGVINMVTNIVTITIFTYIFKEENVFGIIGAYPGSALKYLILSTIVSLLFSFGYSLLLKYVSVSLDYEKEEKVK